MASVHTYEDRNIHFTRYYEELIKSNDMETVLFTGFSETDMKLLHDAKPLFESHIEELVEAFYTPILNVPHLTAIIDQYSSVRRLKETFRKYIMNMVSGKIGQEYLTNRHAIGRVHHRIGLDANWYLGANTTLQNAVFELLMNNWKKDRNLIAATYQAFQRLSSIDSQITISTYIDDYPGFDHRFKKLVSEICFEDNLEVLSMETDKDHVHLFMNASPTLGPSNIMARIKGKTSKILREEFREIRHLPSLWTRSSFVSTAGNVSSETIQRYVENQRKR